MPTEVPMPSLPAFLARDSSRPDYATRDLRAGFSFDLWLRLESLEAGQRILDNRTPDGRGFCLHTTERGTLEILLNDGRTENRWDCDPDLLQPGRCHHVGVVVDGGPKILTFVVDGRLCDGAEHRQFGWGRFSPHLRGVQGSERLRIVPGVQRLRLYNCALRTSEMVGNFRAGPHPRDA